jgi:ribosomal protein S18 acetylase RimI-like enzyme
MLLAKPTLEKYIDEIVQLYRKELGEEVKSATHFGIIEGTALQAVGSVKCYSGHWYLRGCVVKPEFRGRGFQRRLIQERLEYLAAKTDIVRVGVYPGNEHSLRNIEAECFEFEKNKKLKNGKIVQIYKISLSL